MIYSYLKAAHIIFVVTWFTGMFYMPRLFIYSTEANDKDAVSKKILQDQFAIMMKRLWYGITIPSAVVTLLLGPYLMFSGGWHHDLAGANSWLLVKLIFVFFLYAYFYSLHVLFKQQLNGIYKYTSQQLRVWNEVATIFLFAIVFLAVVKSSLSWVTGLAGLLVLLLLLMSGIKLYKKLREK